MTYVAPTFTDFLQRFPEFQGTPDQVVVAVLAEALGDLDDAWGDADRRTAGLYLTAHMLALEGYPGRNNGGLSPAEMSAAGGVLREKVGDVEVQYAGVKAEGFDQTSYGKRYLALVRRNHAGVFIV